MASVAALRMPGARADHQPSHAFAPTPLYQFTLDEGLVEASAVHDLLFSAWRKPRPLQRLVSQPHEPFCDEISCSDRPFLELRAENSRAGPKCSPSTRST